MENPCLSAYGRMGYPMRSLEPSEKNGEKPTTLTGVLGLAKGTRVPGLLRLLKSDCPISEIVEATKTWAKNPVGNALVVPALEVPPAPVEDPQVELPPAPCDPTYEEGAPVTAAHEPVPMTPSPEDDKKVSDSFDYEGIWDTVDLNVHAAKTGDMPCDSVRPMRRWYDPYLVKRHVSAGGFPLGGHGLPHVLDVKEPSASLSVGGYLGGFTPSVRAILVSRYKCIFGYALSKVVATEGSSSLAVSGFAQELGLVIPDVDEVVNAWSPYGYLEVVPFNNLRWGSRGHVDRLLMEGLVMVKITVGRSGPMVFGHMGTCLEAGVTRENDGPQSVLSGTALMGKGYSLTHVGKISCNPSDELVPTFILPPDLIHECVLDVDTHGGVAHLLDKGRAWKVEASTRLPGGRYRVSHSGLPETSGSLRFCVTDWLTSSWLSASGRMSFLAAREPLWCAMVRPAWLHVLDPYVTTGQTRWKAVCHVPGSRVTASWDGSAIDSPEVALRTDGLYGTRAALRAYGYVSALSALGSADAMRLRFPGRERDRWVGHAYRQWLIVHGGSVWIDSTVRSLAQDSVTQWNPRIASSYAGAPAHLSALGATVTGGLSHVTCLYGGKCDAAPQSHPCYCKTPQSITHAFVPRLDSEGKYTASLPLTGNGLLYASYGLPYSPASHGIVPGYVGSNWSLDGLPIDWHLPQYDLKEGVNIQDKLHLDCLVFNRRRKRSVRVQEEKDPAIQGDSGEILRIVPAKRPKCESALEAPDGGEGSPAS